MSHKSVQKPLAEAVVQLEVLGVHMRRINYDSAAVNIYVFKLVG